jgi:hypothetical protein
MRKKPTTLVPDFVSSLPQATEPNQQIHADLFGPLRKQKKFILCIINAFTKYVQLVTLPNKEAATVASAIFEHWICHFGTPIDLIVDQGKELCARVSEDLLQCLGLAHLSSKSLLGTPNATVKPK